ncbi:hypothetical protein DV736_g3459, partial [Chaetothyriales sp. CBS 134916]
MVDPVGTAIGGISLAIQLLDGALKGYTFFLAVGDFPESCLHLRTRLEIEQKNILDFSEAAELLGITTVKNEAKVPRVLRKDYLVLGSIFKQIETKLDTLASFTTRYKELESDKVGEEEEDVIEAIAEKEQTPILLKWQGAAKAREHVSGTNHIRKYYRIGKSIVQHPKRLRWTAIDEKKFMTVLDELAGYNAYLRDRLDDEYTKRLEERTVKTYQEMVLVRDKIDDLTHLVQNAMHGYAGHQLQALARTKSLAVANDAADDDKPPQYVDLINVDKLEFNHIKVENPPVTEEVAVERKRSIGTFQATDVSEARVPVFIEWKRYIPTTEANAETRPGAPLPENTDRVKGLVKILQSSKLDSFRAPDCVGFFDLRDGAINNKHTTPSLFGVVYRIPGDRSTTSVMPITLMSQLGSQPIPSLSARMKLAYLISDSLLYFNAVQWYHKTLRSDAIIFHQDPKTKSIDITQPFLGGFEYARPGGSASSTRVPPKASRELYVHPFYQGDQPREYARSYDIYALGIILLEIAYWRPINVILADLFKNPGDPSRKEAEELRGRLLSAGSPYLLNLKGLAGDRYFKAVHSCIAGIVSDQDIETEIEVSLRLHEGFRKQIVENLSTLRDL